METMTLAEFRNGALARVCEVNQRIYKLLSLTQTTPPPTTAEEAAAAVALMHAVFEELSIRCNYMDLVDVIDTVDAENEAKRKVQ